MDGAEKAKESPIEGVTKRWQKCSEEQCQQVTGKRRRSRVTVQEDSAKQLDALGQCLPDLTDSDTKILALRMHCTPANGSPRGLFRFFSSVHAEEAALLACLLELGISSGGF